MTRDGYKKHKAVIEAWGNGAELEYKESSGGHWQPFNVRDPYFREDQEYRVKPVPLEVWVVAYETGTLYASYSRKDLADTALRNSATPNRLRVVRMKEVVDE